MNIYQDWFLPYIILNVYNFKNFKNFKNLYIYNIISITL